MRNREQFKAYVYAKADAEMAKGKKRRRMICSMVAACSVCICVVSAVFLMPQNLQDKSADMYENETAFAAPRADGTDANAEETRYAAAETGAALKETGAVGGTEAAISPGEFEDDTPDAVGNETGGGNTLLKSCLFSVSSNNNMLTSNSLVRTAFYEILEDAENAEETAADVTAAGESDGGRKDVRIAVTAYYLKKPEVSDITVSYSGDAVTVTVFADAEPIPFGAYVYYFTETLDGKRYFGQPIQLEFKLTSEKENMKRQIGDN